MARATHTYPHKDGDTVVLLEPARVDGYWYDPDTMIRGSYDNHFMLPGSVGTVIKAKTPAVWSGGDLPDYFANVDIPHCGVVSRVRVYHYQLGKP